MTVRAEAFEALVREELAKRDRQRRARIMDPLNYEAADAAFIAAVLAGAGFKIPEHAEKTIRRGRRAAAVNEAAAFDGAA